MRKFILFFVLTLIFLTFGIFFFRVYVLQQNHLKSEDDFNDTQTTAPVVLDANPSVYKNYSKEDYDKAITEKRVLMLFFTSNWCSECLTQSSINEEAFMELNKEGVVGLSIHILDSETTTETDALAKKFDVTKESSFVILDEEGKVDSKYVGSIMKENLKQKILSAKEVN